MKKGPVLVVDFLHFPSSFFFLCASIVLILYSFPFKVQAPTSPIIIRRSVR